MNIKITLASIALLGASLISNYSAAASTKQIPGFIPSTQVAVALSTQVAYKPLTGTFVYTYNVSSGPSSQQDVWAVAIESSAPLKGTGTPQGWSSGPMEGTSFWLWASDDAPFRIKPGRSLSGFALESQGLPGIQTFHAQGKVLFPDSISFDGEGAGLPPGITLEDYKEATSFFNNSIKGVTVGPTNILSNTSTSNVISYLIDQKHTAAKLGWIDNQGIVESLDKKLDAALASIGRGQPKTAFNQIDAFQKEVSAQNGKHITQDAASILSAGADLLKARL